MRRRFRASILSVALVASAFCANVAVAAPGDLTLISTNSVGDKLDLGVDAQERLQVSDDGSIIAFDSQAGNTLVGPPFQSAVYVKNVATGIVTLASAAANGDAANGGSYWSDLSRNGRYVAFVSTATNLDPADTDTIVDVYVKDLQTGAIKLASTNSAGVKGTHTGIFMIPAVSSDGNTVVYSTNAGNFDPSHTPKTCIRPPGQGHPLPEPFNCTEAEIYLKRLDTGVATLLTLGDNGFGGLGRAEVSNDGKRIAFSTQDPMVSNDTDGRIMDTYVRDMDAGTLTLASTNLPEGSPDNVVVGIGLASMSADGRRIVFDASSDVGVWDPRYVVAGLPQIYLKDLDTGVLSLLSVNKDGEIANDSSQAPVISADGTRVAFASMATNLHPADTDAIADVFVRDLVTGDLSLVSVRADGTQPDDHSFLSALVADPQIVFFATWATNLDPRDNDPYTDIYRKELPLAGPVDADADGTEDGVDLDGGAGTSPAGAFSDDTADGHTTTGQIVTAAGLDVDVSDAPDPDGVRIVVGPGAGRATFSVCGGFTIRVNAGSEVVVTCGSVTVKVVAGSATIELGGGITVVSIPQGGSATVTALGPGKYSVKNIGTTAVTVTVDGNIATVPAGSTSTVATWDFVGFSQPVDNMPVLNKVNSGQAVPIKWRLLDVGGAPITNLQSATLTVTSLNCSLGTTVDLIEETVAGASGLQNLGNGYYQINWKSPKTYANSCKSLHLDVGDGVTHTASFQFPK